MQENLRRFDDLWDYDHPDRSEERFRELLQKARDSGDHTYLAELLTQIARSQGLQRRFDEAHTTLDEAESSSRSPALVLRFVICSSAAGCSILPSVRRMPVRCF